MIDPKKIEEMKAAPDEEVIAWLDGMPWDEQQAAMKQLMDGETMDGEMLLMIATFADQAVDLAIEEVLRVAAALGTDMVPTAVLAQLLDTPKIATTVLWAQIEKLGIDLKFDVPNDISELL